MSEYLLLDAVRFGVPESEQFHEPVGFYANRQNDDPGVAYGEVPLIKDIGGLLPLRFGAGWWGVSLNVPEHAGGKPGRLEFMLQAHASSGVEDLSRKPTRLYFMTRTRLHPLGEFVVNDQDWAWNGYTFDVPAQVMEPGEALLIVDDRDNLFSLETFRNHASGSLELFVKEDTPPLVDFQHVTFGNCDVVLVMCPVWDVRMPPIALGTMASYLTAKGLKVKVVDFNMERFHDSVGEGRDLWHGSTAERWFRDSDFSALVMDSMEKPMQVLAEKIAASSATHIGFSLATTNAAITIGLSNMLKILSPEKRIVYGGPGVPFMFEGGLGESWDYLVLGAGEHAFHNLVTEGPDGVEGILKKGDSMDIDPVHCRARLKDLDELPLLDYAAFDLNLYTNPWRLPMVTSRGCVNKCKYCFDAGYYAPFRFLNGRRAFEQMKHLLMRHGRRRFELADLLCNGDMPALREMCELIIESGLPFEWGSFAIIREDMTREDLDKMYAAGCRYLHYGFETGSETLLDIMGRNYNLDAARKVMADTHASGVKVRINIMVGFPGETDETIAETIEFIRENGKNIDSVETVNPVYLMTSTDLDKRREDWNIETPEGEGRWQSGDVTMDRRRHWVETVMKAVRDAGVKCKYSVIQDFEAMDVCLHTDDLED